MKLWRFWARDVVPAYGKRQGYLSAARLEHTDSVSLPQSLEKAFASKQPDAVDGMGRLPHRPIMTEYLRWIPCQVLPTVTTVTTVTTMTTVTTVTTLTTVTTVATVAAVATGDTAGKFQP